MINNTKALQPALITFVSLDVALVVFLVLVERDPLAVFFAGTGLGLTFCSWERTPYVFFALQQVAIFVGLPFVFLWYFGEFPGGAYDSAFLDASLAVLYVGFGMVALGVRIGAGMLPRISINASQFSIKVLFVSVLVLFLPDWALRIEVNSIGGGFAQIINEVLKFRYLFFVLLLFASLASKSGGRYVVMAAIFILVPQTTSHMSGFAGVPMLIVYAAFSYIILVKGEGWTQTKLIGRLVLIAVLSVAVLTAGLVWSGGIKPVWRTAVLSGEVGAATIDRLSVLPFYLGEGLARFVARDAVEQLASRTSSGLFFTAMAMERVPSILPHENGGRTLEAVKHILAPRLFFPNKPVLESDSELVRLYTGQRVSGVESGSSIGFGYIAEFYVDFGMFGAAVACFVFGLYVGLIFRIWHKYGHSPLLAHGAAILLAWSSLNVPEASLVKLIGSVTMQGLIFLVLMLALLRLISSTGLFTPTMRRAPSVAARKLGGKTPPKMGGIN